jgi:hypothetical protein
MQYLFVQEYPLYQILHTAFLFSFLCLHPPKKNTKEQVTVIEAHNVPLYYLFVQGHLYLVKKYHL